MKIESFRDGMVDNKDLWAVAIDRDDGSYFTTIWMDTPLRDTAERCAMLIVAQLHKDGLR